MKNGLVISVFFYIAQVKYPFYANLREFQQEFAA